MSVAAVAANPCRRYTFADNRDRGVIIMPHRALLALAGILTLASTTAAIADDTGLAYSHTLRKEGGRLCMADHYHSGSGEGRSKDGARKAAIRSWADFTNFEYGTVWARFSLAASPSTRFSKEANGWSAYIDARPCRR